MRNEIFPFSAIVGQEKAKKSILLNIINPKIGGVLFSGEKGTAKSTLVRSISGIFEEIKVINVPLNITEDRLKGGIDFESTLITGKKNVEVGLLKEANKNILYIDEVNLLGDHIINCILETMSTGINVIEREGVTGTHESKFVLIGSMNPEEGELRSQFLEKFGLFVSLKGCVDINDRIEIIQRRLEYEKDKNKFYEKYSLEKSIIYEKIKKAQELLKSIPIGDEIINLALKIVIESNVPGNNTEMILIETAKTIAAYDGRKYINIDDLKEASEYVLTHRMRNNENNENNKNSQQNTQDNQKERDNSQEENESKQGESQNDMGEAQDKIFSTGELFKVRDINIDDFKKKKLPGSGKRCRTASDSTKGRYIRSIQPKEKIKDLAFDATLRIAAPYQKYLKNEKLAIVIKQEHIREKVREKRVGTTILFSVDASGSMGAKDRMILVKSTILSLLKNAYEKRDKVGMVAFRKNAAEELLPVTRSISLANKKLENLPTGGRTPLYDGLYKAYRLLKNEIRKNPKVIPILILITDGRYNVFQGDNPTKDILELCKTIQNDGIKSIIIDSEIGVVKLEMAKDICKALNGKYYRLEELKEGELLNIIDNNRYLQDFS